MSVESVQDGWAEDIQQETGASVFSATETVPWETVRSGQLAIGEAWPIGQEDIAIIEQVAAINETGECQELVNGGWLYFESGEDKVHSRKLTKESHHQQDRVNPQEQLHLADPEDRKVRNISLKEGRLADTGQPVERDEAEHS